MKESIFWIFGTLQAMILGVIIFLLLSDYGTDTRILLSVLFPAFTLIIEYMIYSKQ